MVPWCRRRSLGSSCTCGVYVCDCVRLRLRACLRECTSVSCRQKCKLSQRAEKYKLSQRAKGHGDFLGGGHPWNLRVLPPLKSPCHGGDVQSLPKRIPCPSALRPNSPFGALPALFLAPKPVAARPAEPKTRLSRDGRERCNCAAIAPPLQRNNRRGGPSYCAQRAEDPAGGPAVQWRCNGGAMAAQLQRNGGAIAA